MYKRNQQRVEAKLRRHRKARGNQFVDAAPGILEGWAQIASRQITEIGRVLLPQRQVEAVLGFECRFYLGNDRFFAGKRSAGCYPYQKKGHGDDHQ